MIHFLAWYLVVTMLGWLAFPLAWRMFPGLADRGFTLTRALGLFIWGYLFWMFASLKVIQNDAAGIFLALIVTLLLVAWVARNFLFSSPAPITSWIRTNKRLVITVEILFLLVFAAWSFVRASNPNIETAGGEKTMELAFINAILHSPTFPPHDPWLSGFSISYYYFGYVLTAMLAKITFTSGGIAHNLMLALVFSLSFIGMYGILFNLLAAWRKYKNPGLVDKTLLRLSPLGPLFLLFISNLAGFLEVLHRRGVGWQDKTSDSNLWMKLGKLVRPNLQANNFWTWLDIKHLNSPPAQPYQWTPDRFIWWWQDSRVIQDYDLAGNFTEIIDEFPAFSFLLGDLHPHVLAMPAFLLVIACSLNLFMGGWKGKINFHWFTIPIHPVQLLFSGLLLGGLAFLNTWDILPGFALLLGGYVLVRARQHGWSVKRLWELFAFGIPLGLIAFLLYIPFFLGFSSQAGGILPNLEYPTRGAHLWVMFGTLFVPILITLLYLRWGKNYRLNKWIAICLGLGIPILLWLVSWLLGWVAQLKLPEFTASYLGNQGFSSLGQFFSAVLVRRLVTVGGLLTILSILIPSIGFLTHTHRETKRMYPVENDHDVEEITTEEEVAETNRISGRINPSGAISSTPIYFLLFIIFLGAMLVLAPEFVYLRDLFGKRMNTIFKFYFQAWMLWSVAASFGMAVLVSERRRVWRLTSTILLAVLLVVGLCFTVFGLLNKTDNFQAASFRSYLQSASQSGDPAALKTAIKNTWTLDGTQLFHQMYPDDAKAADWLSTATAGVVAEAVGGSYSDFGRISVYSGLPSVVGWIGHEDQWRGTFSEQRQRGEIDIPTLYETNNWEEADGIIQWYNIKYIVVGTLENRIYRVNQEHFRKYLVPVFQSGEVTIYQVPWIE